MTKSNVMRPLARANAFVTAAVIASAALLPAMLLSGSASAAQLQNRYIDLSSYLSSGGDSSAGSGRDSGDSFGQGVTYTVGFDLPVTGNIGAVAVDFCSNSPILLDTCTAPAGFDVSTATVANQVGISGFTVDALTSANLFVVSGTAGSVTSNTADTTTIDGLAYPNSDIKFDIVGVDNPSALGSFYARITTYASDTDLPSVAWDSTVAAATTGVGTYVDDGGIAMSIARELTVTARVQEVLEFCIGTEADSAVAGFTGIPADGCGEIAGTDIDLGVVDSNGIQRTSDGDIANDGIALIRTNAVNGAAVYYKAEQDNAIAYTNGGEGTLRLSGVDTCGTLASVANACFNSAGGDVTDPTQTAISAGTELFGMTLTNLSTGAGGATTALSCDTDYDGDGSCATGAATGYAWDPTGAFDRIASASGPTDDERAQIEFAATASPTTPTGLYTVVANFVATSTF